MAPAADVMPILKWKNSPRFGALAADAFTDVELVSVSVLLEDKPASCPD